MEMNPRPFHMSAGLVATNSAGFFATTSASANLYDAVQSPSSTSSSPSPSFGFIQYINGSTTSGPQPPPLLHAAAAKPMNYAATIDAGLSLTNHFLQPPSFTDPGGGGGVDGRQPSTLLSPSRPFNGLHVDIVLSRIQAMEKVLEQHSVNRTDIAAADTFYHHALDESHLLYPHHTHPHHNHRRRGRHPPAPSPTAGIGFRDPLDHCGGGVGVKIAAEDGGDNLQVRRSCASPVLQLKSCSSGEADAMAMGMSGAGSSNLGLMLGHGGGCSGAAGLGSDAEAMQMAAAATFKHRKRGKDALVNDQWFEHALRMTSGAGDLDPHQRFGLVQGGQGAYMLQVAEGGGVDHDSILCRARAKRGCATHPRSIAERVRRTKISERMKKLQDLVPNLDKQAHTADMLDEVVEYVKQLQQQIQVLSQSTSKCKGKCQSRIRISNNDEDNGK